MSHVRSIGRLLATFVFVLPLAVGPTGHAAAVPARTCSAGPSIVFNPCADLDLTQIEDCRGGTCYKFCWTHYETVWCEKYFEFTSIRNWLKYKMGTKPPRGCHTT